MLARLLSSTRVWAPGTAPLPQKPWSSCGRLSKLMRRNRQHQPVATLVIGLPVKAWRTITWRQGTNEMLTSRFARTRVHAAHRDYWQTTRRLGELVADRMAKRRGPAYHRLALDIAGGCGIPDPH